MPTNNKRVLVTGGGTFLGDNIAAALLAEGAEVTLLVRPEAEERVTGLRTRVRVVAADVWDPASLRGRARGHLCVVNTVGSMTAAPAQGLTYHRLNFVSARNVTNMVISDGVPHNILISTTRAPWMNRQYVAAKREAEEYVKRVGVSTTVIRAPLIYLRGKPRPLFFTLVSALGSVPPLSWTHMGRVAPMPVDVLARAVARLALNPRPPRALYFAPDLRKLNSRDELRHGASVAPADGNPEDDTEPRRRPPRASDETPFGWVPRD